MAQTCYHLDNTKGWHERNLPTQSCAGVVGMTAGFIAAGEVLGYVLHRHNHHLLEQAPRAYLLYGNLRGLVYSSQHAK